MTKENDFLTMTVAAHLKPLQREARLTMARALYFDRVTLPKAGGGNAALEESERRHHKADVAFDRYNEAYRDWLNRPRETSRANDAATLLGLILGAAVTVQTSPESPFASAWIHTSEPRETREELTPKLAALLNGAAVDLNVAFSKSELTNIENNNGTL